MSVFWTVHEIFDADFSLLRNCFRLPFYSFDNSPEELFDQNLQFFSKLALYTRVSIPGDPDYDMQYSPERFKEENYLLPGIHNSEIRRIYKLMDLEIQNRKHMETLQKQMLEIEKQELKE